MVTEEEILGYAHEIVQEAAARGGLERGWPDRRLPNSYRESPNTAWGGRGTDADYGALETSHGWIVGAFQNAMPPDPSVFGPLAETMNNAATALRGGTRLRISDVTINSDGKPMLVEDEQSRDGDIGTLTRSTDSALSTWIGDAAFSFRTNFVNRIPTVIENQTAIALSLQSAAEGCQKVYEATRDKLKIIATTTLNVLRYKDDTASPDLSIPLSMASGGFALAAAVPGIGTAAVIVLTTVSAGVAVGKDIYTEARDEAKDKQKARDAKKTPAERAVDGCHIGGATVDAILNSAYEAIKMVSRQYIEAEDTIIKMLENNIDAMRDVPRNFLSPRPYFVDYTNSANDLRTLRDGHFVSASDTGHATGP